MSQAIYEQAEGFFKKLGERADKYDTEKIKTAYELAYHAHDGQFRQSGEPYITHPLSVAESVLELGLDTDTVCAALLHDTLEDCPDAVTVEGIRATFGDDVVVIVEGVTKILTVTVEDKEEQHIENIRKMMLAISKDIRVVIVKLCDRLHNMRTLGGKKNGEKQRQIALETMYVYAPLAHRLGMQRIKLELENLALLYLDPIGYNEVTDAVGQRFGTNRTVLAGAKRRIEDRVKDYGIPYEVEDRIKSVYSLYRKMYEQGKSFEDIYDFYALRVIVNTIEECYTVLGLVHEMFTSIPGRFKDYISMPKPNMYRSLHTTVMSRDGVPFEVQIRTREMHQTAEFGIAAHWRYKAGGGKVDPNVDKQLAWIAELIETEDGMKDPDEYLHSFKSNIFREEIFVFTPKGDVISLPHGATTIDFAYTIHTAVGNKMVGAKVNGVIVPIDRTLQTGDVVEILTQTGKGPSRDWLKIVTTSEARGKIRQWFKKEKRPENIALGQDMVEKELRRHGHAFTPKESDAIIDTVAGKLGLRSAEDLFDAVGYGGIALTRVSVRLREEAERFLKTQATVNANNARQADEAVIADVQEKSKEHTGRNHGNGGVVVDGASGCLVKFAKCCNPLPGDSVIGFVTRGFGVSVHKRDCPNAVAGVGNPEQAGRWLSAHWEEERGKATYEAALCLYAEDKIGVLAEVSAALAEMKVPVLTINVAPPKEGRAVINLTVGCRDTGHYNSIVARLKSISTVLRISRGQEGNL